MCVCTYRCVVRDGRAVCSPYGSVVAGSRLAFLLCGSRRAALLGEVERVLHACSHPKRCLDSLVVIAASWGLKVGFQISDSGRD